VGLLIRAILLRIRSETVFEKRAEQVDLFTAVANMYRYYGTFTGRSSRSEYWYIWLFSVILFVPFLLLTIANETLGAVVFGIYAFGTFIPSVALTVRRIRDVGISPYMIFLSLIPFVGGLLVTIICIFDSDSDVWDDFDFVGHREKEKVSTQPGLLGQMQELQALFDGGLIDKQQLKAAKDKLLGI
jgi:uncharacterized membrane protein YhaH (DUF805 family)